MVGAGRDRRDRGGHVTELRRPAPDAAAPELPAPEHAQPMRIATSAPAPVAPAGPEPAQEQAQPVQPYDESVPGEGPPTGALYLAGGLDDAIPVHGTAIGPDTGSVTVYPPDTGSIPVIEDAVPEPAGSSRPASPAAETGTGWPATTGDPGQAGDASGGTGEPGEHGPVSTTDHASGVPGEPGAPPRGTTDEAP